MRYLVTASGGPGFASAEEAIPILQNVVLPTFEAMKKLEDEGKVVAGGLPVGERSFVFIVEAASHKEVDQLLRNIPMWGMLDWEVTPLQSFEGRAEVERDFVQQH